MNRILTGILICLTAHQAWSQTYNSPESVEKPDGNYFVSNNGSGEIIKLLPNGTLQSFASGLTTGPHGLELLGDTLYACDGGIIRLYNRSTGALINSVNLGASFLNGITHRGSDLFITDFSAKKIYRLNTVNNTFYSFVPSLPKTPNGIVYDDIHDRLVFVCWGSSAPVYEVNPADSTYTLLTTTTVGNIDGIAMNCQGDFYISGWTPNVIRKYSSDFTTTSVVATTGISSPADIYFDETKDSLYVPNSGSANNVLKVYAASCLTTGMGNPGVVPSIKLFPNPSDGIFTLAGITGSANIAVTDIAGNVVWSQSVNNSMVNIEIPSVAKGIYLLRVTMTNATQTFKIERQ